MSRAFFVALLAAPSVWAVPSFPTEWNAQVNNKIALFQGGTHNSDGSVCCSKTAPQCKVQTQSVGGKQFVDGHNNRTLLSTGPQAIISLYAEKKQISAVPSSSGKGWHCKQFCPLQDGYRDPLQFGKNAKDMGPVQVGGKTYEKWRWYDNLIIIHMDENDWLVDQSDPAHPVPYSQTEKITPFGGAEIGESSQSFDQFTPATTDPDTFSIDNLDDKTCEEGQCNNNNNDNVASFGRQAEALWQVQHRTLGDLAADAAAAAAPTPPALQQQPLDGTTWPDDFSVTEDADMIINQGGLPSADGSQICCAGGYGQQCQVQVQFQHGVRYYDHSHQRTRFENSANQVTVDDYTIRKSMEVQHNGTHDVCVKYCPIDKDDTMDNGKGFFLRANASDLGPGTFMNRSAEHYQWKDKIFKIVTMSTTDLYADQSGATVVPLGVVETLTPFGGRPIGAAHTTYTSFQPGAQPADKFDIQGVDTCPQDQGCNAPPLQLHRLASGQRHTFARYLNIVSRGDGN